MSSPTDNPKGKYTQGFAQPRARNHIKKVKLTGILKLYLIENFLRCEIVIGNRAGWFKKKEEPPKNTVLLFSS
jgi:hypothetical protein